MKRPRTSFEAWAIPRTSFEAWAIDPVSFMLDRLRLHLRARRPWPPGTYGRRVESLAAVSRAAA